MHLKIFVVVRYIIILDSARSVVKAEKLCKMNSVSVRVVPLPEVYSSECGMGLLVEGSIEDRVKELLQSNNIEFRIYIYN